MPQIYRGRDLRGEVVADKPKVGGLRRLCAVESTHQLKVGFTGFRGPGCEGVYFTLEGFPGGQAITEIAESGYEQTDGGFFMEVNGFGPG